MNTPVNAIQPYESTALADFVFAHQTMSISMFSELPPLPRITKKDGHPVVSIAEDSNTLRLLLDSIYPTSEERCLNDMGLFWKAAKASQKYCMKIIEDKLRKRVLASDLMKCHSLGMYAVATDLGWDDVAIAAARQTL
ncbi:hypothetical protein M378DRAFT_21409 [Amanita muscaria Koide BX008]|uniref:BTB domain-containing protein n=1 Tax=Amanita muscaria (strain Koide BX008) TaxID=946122 RepID=A0A0C2TPQ2_AMAMK|nr:hypothetical protein M378DRAFT_21409 [Amanita muscaria Koide BX008]